MASNRMMNAAILDDSLSIFVKSPPKSAGDGCSFPPLNISVLDADTGVSLNTALITISEPARHDSTLMVGVPPPPTGSSKKALKPVELKTQRVLKSKDAEKCIGRVVECVLPGYQLVGRGLDATGRPLEPSTVLTREVLSRGRLELSMKMNTNVQLQIMDAKKNDEVTDQFRIPVRIFSKPPVSRYSAESFAESSSLVGGVGGSAVAGVGAPPCSMGCAAGISTGDLVYSLTCGHVFHVDCLKRVLAMTNRKCLQCGTPPPNVCPCCDVPFVAKEIAVECKSGQELQLPAVCEGQRQIAFDKPTSKADDSDWELLSVIVKKFVYNPATGVMDVMGMQKYDGDDATAKLNLKAEDWPVPSGPLTVIVNVRKVEKEDDE